MHDSEAPQPAPRSTASTRVAGTVRAAMGNSGMSQVALSEATGISRTTLSRRLNGQIPFTMDELAAIANHLGVRASDLLAAA